MINSRAAPMTRKAGRAETTSAATGSLRPAVLVVIAAGPDLAVHRTADPGMRTAPAATVRIPIGRVATAIARPVPGPRVTGNDRAAVLGRAAARRIDPAVTQTPRTAPDPVPTVTALTEAVRGATIVSPATTSRAVIAVPAADRARTAIVPNPTTVPSVMLTGRLTTIGLGVMLTGRLTTIGLGVMLTGPRTTIALGRTQSVPRTVIDPSVTGTGRPTKIARAVMLTGPPTTIDLAVTLTGPPTTTGPGTPTSPGVPSRARWTSGPATTHHAATTTGHVPTAPELHRGPIVDDPTRTDPTARTITANAHRARTAPRMTVRERSATGTPSPAAVMRSARASRRPSAGT